MQLNGLLAAPGFEQWLEGEPLDPRTCSTRRRASRASRSSRSPTSATPSGCSSCRCCSTRWSAGCAAQTGHDEPARDPLHGRDRRLLPAGGEPAVEGAAADAAQAGARVRPRRACWRRRTRWTSTTRAWRTPAPGSSAGSRPSATRRACSTGSKARRRAPRSRRGGSHALGAGQARVPPAQRARRGPGRVSDSLDAVLPARAAVARADQVARCAPARTAPAGTPGSPSAAAPQPATRAADPRRGPGLQTRPRRSVPSCRPGFRSGSSKPPAEATRYSPVVLGAARVSFSDRALGVDATADLLLLRAGLRRRDSGQLGGGRERLDIRADDLARAPAAPRHGSRRFPRRLRSRRNMRSGRNRSAAGSDRTSG